MSKNKDFESVHDLLAYIQQNLKAPKNQTNNFGGYKYRSCEDILEAVKPLLNGGTLTLSDFMVEVAGRPYVKATATLRYKDKDERVTAFAREAEIQKGMSDSQLTGATSSYARKYALNGLFLIDDTKDADTQDNSGYSCDICGEKAEVKTAKDGSGVKALVCTKDNTHKKVMN